MVAAWHAQACTHPAWSALALAAAAAHANKSHHMQSCWVLITASAAQSLAEHRRPQRANQKEKEQTEKGTPQRLNRERKVEKEKA